MKSKVDILHGMIKDLMRVPLHESHAPSEHEPKAVHMTAIAVEKPKGEEDDDDMEDPDGDGIPDALDPMDHQKTVGKERAIHSKHKGMI